MSTKSISKLFNSNKLNSINQIVGGLSGTGASGSDTVNGSNYDVDTTSSSGGCDGKNTGFSDSDNPMTDFKTRSSYTMI